MTDPGRRLYFRLVHHAENGHGLPRRTDIYKWVRAFYAERLRETVTGLAADLGYRLVPSRLAWRHRGKAPRVRLGRQVFYAIPAAETLDMGAALSSSDTRYGGVSE